MSQAKAVLEKEERVEQRKEEKLKKMNETEVNLMVNLKLRRKCKQLKVDEEMARKIQEEWEEEEERNRIAEEKATNEALIKILMNIRHD
ncbi:hypothetical protein Tco_1154833 [Tanacetum coccineum]